jgi:hypothetical protein
VLPDSPTESANSNPTSKPSSAAQDATAQDATAQDATAQDATAQEAFNARTKRT